MVVSLVALLVMCLPISYLFVLALAAIRPPRRPNLSQRQPTSRFIIAIPAHNEGSVIAASVRCLQNLDYPADLYSIHIVADHCSDGTAALARTAGAIVHERNQSTQSGKGEALKWLFERTLECGCDAVVVFDSDTQADAQFLRLMDARLAQGAQVIQGQHIISNSTAGWFPALTWAMFLIDNRFQNWGRAVLGWSAKNMGDSICFRADILRWQGWGEGLTEDYQLRQRLLLNGIRITYEPFAKGYGEAPRTWAQARAQRARWLRGTRQASRQWAYRLLIQALRGRDLALLDGALQAYLPSFSTLTCLCGLTLGAHWLLSRVSALALHRGLLYAWALTCAALFIYPLLGLALEKAPLRAYLVILTGPLFVVWRTALAITARASRQPPNWVRTAHGEIQ